MIRGLNYGLAYIAGGWRLLLSFFLAQTVNVENRKNSKAVKKYFFHNCYLLKTTIYTM